MRIIAKIAKNEFRYLFYSPIAWFILIIFLVQCALFYTGIAYDTANIQEIMLKNSPSFKESRSLTLVFFLVSGFFINIMRNLYLFIPLLTMGLMSREIDNSTVKLLYSSPVKLRQIVLGKYLGIMLYNLLLVLIVGIFVFAGVLSIKNVDYGPLLSAILGFYLLLCAYAAIGLFMSTLSTYQLVSAFSTFIIIFILTRIGGLWQKYDFIRDLTYFLSLQNRTWKMLAGLIVSRDVIYFIAVTGMFVGFTLVKLRAGREARPWLIKVGRYALVTAVVLTVGYISSRPTLTGYLDTTATKRNTIPPPMQKIMKDLGDSTLEVTLYTNLFGGGLMHGMPENRNSDYLSGLWDPYLRFKPDIIFKYKYYYDFGVNGDDSTVFKEYGNKSLKQLAEEAAETIDADVSLFNSPQVMRKEIDLRPEGYRLVMQVKYRGRTEFLRTYDDEMFWPDLTNISAAFKQLLGTKPPKVYFATGELERSIYKTGDREYALHTAFKGSRGALVNIGFKLDTLNLASDSVPADADMLIMADPKMVFTPAVSGNLKKFIDRGGNMLITAEPGKQHVLNPILQQLGVQLMNGQFVEPTFDETPDKVRPFMASEASNLYEQLAGIRHGLEVEKDTLKAFTPGATGIINISDSLFTVKPLLMTMPGRVWLKAGSLVIDSTLPPFNPREGDIKKDFFHSSVQLTRTIKNKEQRIILCGDADFASNMRAGYNLYFLIPFYSRMGYNEFPVFMPRIDSKDTFLNINTNVAGIQKTVFVWILPGLLLLWGTVLLIRRKRK